MMRRLGWVVILAAVSGCLTEPPEESVGPNQWVATDFEFYAMLAGGQGFRLALFYTVLNRGTTPIYLDQVCTTVLQRRSGAAWVAAQTPTCPTGPITLEILPPGASQRVSYSINGISGNSLPSLFRLRVALYHGVTTSGEGQVGADPLPLDSRLSNEFTLNPP